MAQVEVTQASLFMEQFVGSGIMEHVHMERTASVGMFVELVPMQVSLGSSTKPQHVEILDPGLNQVFSISEDLSLSYHSWRRSWAMDDYIKAHNLVRKSGKYNFEGCRIRSPQLYGMIG